MKLSTAFRRAARYHLRHSVTGACDGSRTSDYWWTEAWALYAVFRYDAPRARRAQQYMRALGAAPLAFSTLYTPGVKRQQTRFLFLEFAALMAEDEGL